MSALHALVLAAGLGSRFGGRKLLSPWRGGVLLDGALTTALAAPVDRVVLVTGSDADDVAAAARVQAQVLGQSDRLRVILAERYAEGLSQSFKAGLAALPADASGALVFLGDMPVVPLAMAEALARALARGAPAAAPVCRGQRGNPVALSAGLFPQLMAQSGDKGARMVLDGLGDRLALIETEDEGVLLDVDLPGQAPA